MIAGGQEGRAAIFTADLKHRMVIKCPPLLKKLLYFLSAKVLFYYPYVPLEADVDRGIHTFLGGIFAKTCCRMAAAVSSLLETSRRECGVDERRYMDGL